MQEDRVPNRLIKEKSPYLKQHAYNPVDWYPWSEEALHKAMAENKPILVSIGYAACHWCHVMERESFEDDSLAALMNRHFICIKVDREERPDVDQVYMEAVQLMGVNGGWPLNVFLTPDARPFYGGTYFPPTQWGSILKQVSHVFQERREELEKSAEELTQGVRRSEVERFGITVDRAEREPLSAEEQQGVFHKLSQKFDETYGGIGTAPKFPMPALNSYLVRHFREHQEPKALEHLQLTLREMAWGGIYDQIGGGFARYAVDQEWFAPHFEKMLYDNAQLISVYSEAYRLLGSEDYRLIVEETIGFLEREMRDKSGGFYSALDADSEGVEGKFYTWKASELKEILSEDYGLFAEYYQVKEEGNWEDGVNILHRKGEDAVLAATAEMSVPELKGKVEQWKKQLLERRTERVRPGLDDKILASWNGLMLTALCKAYQAIGNAHYLELAQQLAAFLEGSMRDGDRLYHSYQDGTAHLQAYLEDYACVAQGYISLYQCSFEEHWLQKAQQLSQYAMDHFYDEVEGLFFFTDDTGEKLIARKKEIFDSVIPSSNALMLHNLYQLGDMLDWQAGLELANKNLQQAVPMIKVEPRYLTYWASLVLERSKPAIECVIIGEGCERVAQQIASRHFSSNMVFAGAKEQSELPLLKGRTAIDGKTTIYICREKSCRLPVHTVEEALALIEEK